MTPQRLPDRRQARENGRDLGVIVTLRPLDFKQAEQEGLRGFKRRLSQVKAREISQQEHNVRIVGPESPISEIERLPEQLLGLFVRAGVLLCHREFHEVH